MLASEFCNLDAQLIDDNAGQVGGLARWSERLEVDASLQAGDQFAAFGVHRQINSLQQNGDRLGSRFDHAAIFDGHRKDALSPTNYLR